MVFYIQFSCFESVRCGVDNADTTTNVCPNHRFARQRVKCEHAHAGMKRYNSVTAVYRNRVPDFDDRLMLIAAGLWNFYLDTA